MTVVLRPGQRIVNIPGIGLSVSRRAVSAGGGGVNWSQWLDYLWLPKGAASLAASYVDVVGSVSASLLGVAPSFDANGWTFTSGGDITQLNTTITSGNNWSAIIRLVGTINAQYVACFGETTTTANATRLNIYPRYTTGPRAYFRSGGNYDQATVYTTDCVLAVTPAKAYANGSALGSVTGAWTGSTTTTITIGGQKINSVLSERWAGTVAAFGLKAGTLDDAQIAAVSAELAAF